MYLFGCFRETLADSNVLAIRTVLCETARTRSHHTFITKYVATTFLYNAIFFVTDNRQFLGDKM